MERGEAAGKTRGPRQHDAADGSAGDRGMHLAGMNWWLYLSKEYGKSVDSVCRTIVVGKSFMEEGGTALMSKTHFKILRNYRILLLDWLTVDVYK